MALRYLIDELHKLVSSLSLSYACRVQPLQINLDSVYNFSKHNRRGHPVIWSQIAILDKGNGGVADSDDLICLIQASLFVA